MYQYIINNQFNDTSIRDFLSYFNISQKKINWIIHEKKYHVNGEYSGTLKTGDILVFDDDCFNEKFVKPLYRKIDILYRDEYILVVDKPRNLIIHDENNETLDKIVAGYLESIGLDPIPRHLYRLDKDTTGCMLYALDPLTLAKLSYDLENKTLTKTYLALVCGQVNVKNGTISSKIASDRHVNGKMVITKNGKTALTKYVLLKSNGKTSLLRVVIETGRTHQIRLHLSSINHPIMGDTIYGNSKDNNLQLQAETVKFYHPFMKKSLTIKVRLPIHL